MNGLVNRWNVITAKMTTAGALAAALTLTIGAQASAQVTSADIVDGQVKTPDIASAAVTTPKIANSAVTSAKLANGAVTNSKLATNAVTGATVQDDSLTGADINEQTLADVNAATLGGRNASDLRVDFGTNSASNVVTLPACNPGLAYMTVQFSGGNTVGGQVLFTASFTAGTGTNFSSPFGVAARLERVTPTPILGDWQESHFGSGGAGRTNIAVTQAFPIALAPEISTFVLRVCDASDSAGGQTIRGQLSFIYRRPVL